MTILIMKSLNSQTFLVDAQNQFLYKKGVVRKSPPDPPDPPETFFCPMIVDSLTS